MKPPTTSPDFDPGIFPYGAVSRRDGHFEVHQSDPRGTGLSASWHQSTATGTIERKLSTRAEADALLARVADTHPGLNLRIVQVAETIHLTTVHYRPASV